MSNEITCICCGALEQDVEGLVMISSDEDYLCNRCSDLIGDLFDKKEKEKALQERKSSSLLPSEIKALLDESVIGQDAAKKVLAVEIYNHYKRITYPEFEIKKSNILMIGESGTGKTLLVQTLAKMLDLPLVIADMSLITAAGYVGQDIESMLQQLVIAADNDLVKAQGGIILLDEVDKIAKRNLTSSTEKDPGGEGVQQGLLKMLEGSKIPVKVEGIRGNPEIDTSNILFICAGAFFGLDKVLMKNHKSENASIGFSASIEKVDITNKEVDEQDIIEYGFIPEFVGRLPVIVQLQKLTREDYRRILTEPKNSISEQYRKLMEIDDITIEFSEEFYDSIVDNVVTTERGARALRTEFEKRMRDIIYAINDESYGTTISL